MTLKNNSNGLLHTEVTKKDSPLDEQDYVIVEFPDFHTDNNNKKIKAKDLGEKFAAINSFFFDYMKEYHIPTAFVKAAAKNTLKFIKHKRFPFMLKILNVADKRTAKIFGLKEGEQLNLPIFELHMGSGKDTLISESHLTAFELCSNDDLKLINRMCSKINVVLKSYFERRSSHLAEINCYFGKCEDKIYVVDDFTPRSLKVIPFNKESKWPDPYKFNTSVEIKQYTDYLFNLTSA